jgi:uncharacterized membrane protein
MSTIVTIVLSLVLGIVLLTGGDTTTESRLNLLGVILLVFGALLAALTYYLFTRANNGASGQPTAVGQ